MDIDDLNPYIPYYNKRLEDVVIDMRIKLLNEHISGEINRTLRRHIIRNHIQNNNGKLYNAKAEAIPIIANEFVAIVGQ